MKNLQGDIVGITDASGNIVAKYTYDSWGKLISIKDASDVDKTTDTTFIGYINPLRYRGYYYDSETGLYYLNARYYDPEIGRFINADDYEFLFDDDYDLLGYNVFIYCSNSPVIGYDPSGNIRYMNPMDIRFTQDSISSRFQVRRDGAAGAGQPITTLIDGLRTRRVRIADIPPIRIFPSDWIIDNCEDLGLTAENIAGLERGIMFTLDNRRLYAFRQAGMRTIRTRDASYRELEHDAYKLTIFFDPELEQGRTIRVRD